MNNSEPQLLCVESLADLPVLWGIMERLDLPAILDRHFPPPAHWRGDLSCGDVFALWLIFLLSEGNHRLNHLEPWVEQHQLTLSALLGKTVLPKHAHDDRLADLLDRLSRDEHFAALEAELNQRTIRVYELPTDLVRIDATTANSHADVLSPEGLLQFGHSKDDPNRPQLKIATAVLDPLGMPLSTSVVPGNLTDDPLYIPAIDQVRQALGTGGRTYIGDCKMAALDTRAYIHAGGDFYITPLAKTQLNQSQRRELLRGVFEGRETLEPVYRPAVEGEPLQMVAEGFVIEEELTASVDGQTMSWQEKRWLVRSVAYAASAEVALEHRLNKASEKLKELVIAKQGKKRLNQEQIQQAAQRVLCEERVQGLLDYQVSEQVRIKQIRAYKDQPAREETHRSYTIEVQRQVGAIEEQKRELGWQVYASNGPGLALSQVVWAYRDQYRVEKPFARLKGKPLSLTPMYLQDEDRMRGLVHLLSVALRLLTLIEWQVRERLSESGRQLEGIYTGQKGRKCKRPSAELLLRAMKDIHLSVIQAGETVYVLLSPMSRLQQQLIELWGLPENLYTNIVLLIPKPPPNMSER